MKIIDILSEEDMRDTSQQHPPPPTADDQPEIDREQTCGTMSELLVQFAERSSIAVVELKPIKLQFWDHFLACMKMPRGGLNGSGSQHCEFEFVSPSKGGDISSLRRSRRCSRLG